MVHTVRLTGLAPIVSVRTRLLVLGSFPGAASLAAQQYYAHPQNQFWKILEAIWPNGPRIQGVICYENRSNWLLERGLGVWDVYAACEREGSLDAAIRNARVNDFANLARLCPDLRGIAHNGAESFKHAPVVLASMKPAGPSQGAGACYGVQTFKLPSTSPANASWSFERKLAAWREVMGLVGLL